MTATAMSDSCTGERDHSVAMIVADVDVHEVKKGQFSMPSIFGSKLNRA